MLENRIITVGGYSSGRERRIEAPPASLFRSFWIAGFECSTHINAGGRRLDMIAALQHDALAGEDYRAIAGVGMLAARDGVRWNLVDRGGEYDFSPVEPIAAAAERAGVQVIWDLCHYGWPDGLDIFSPAFIDRFARYSGAVARFFRERGGDVPFYTPINEISFFSWAATRDLMYPYARGRDGELKRQLVRAYLASAQAIREVDPRARLVTAEPLIHNMPPREMPHYTGPAQIQRASQFEAFDMLLGRSAPELGGSPHSFDIVGVNFYAANQWEVPGGRKLRWDAGPQDERWVPLRRLLAEVWSRYQLPLFIAETSHYGAGRAAWLHEVAGEVFEARMLGVPVEGICLYPILDRFDWEDFSHWHNSGLFDFARSRNGHYCRALNREYASELEKAQALLAAAGCPQVPLAKSNPGR